VFSVVTNKKKHIPPKKWGGLLFLPSPIGTSGTDAPESKWNLVIKGGWDEHCIPFLDVYPIFGG